MIKSLLLAGAATLVAGAVFAQSPSPGQMNPPTTTQSTPSTQSMPSESKSGMSESKSGNFVRAQQANEWRVARLIGTAVTGPDNAKIGDVNDVLLDKDGKIQSVVLGVGGFLGAGEKEVAIPFNDLTITQTAGGDKIDKIAIRYSKEELKNAPTFEWLKAEAPASSPSSPMSPPPKGR